LFRFRADMVQANPSRLDYSIQEQVHRLRHQQLPIDARRNRIKPPHVIGPGEFNLQPSASAIVAHAADLKIFQRPPRDAERFDAVDTIANPSNSRRTNGSNDSCEVWTFA